MESKDGRLFRQFDLNQDGIITATELLVILRNLGQSVTEKEAEKMIRDVTKNGMNYIDYNRFTKITESQDEEEDMNTSFSLFDKDGNGEITAAELRHQLSEFNKHLSDAQVHLTYSPIRVILFDYFKVDKIVRIADTDGNGKLSLPEFEQISKRLDQSWTATRKVSLKPNTYKYVNKYLIVVLNEIYECNWCGTPMELCEPHCLSGE